MEVKCPRCGEPAKYTPENPYRPFCSERCKLIDLGNWAEGKYSIPVVDHSDIEEEMAEGEPPSEGGDDPSAAPVH
jgi:uncharacterized protein